MVGDFLSFHPNVFVHLSVAKNYTMIDVAATIGGLAAQQFALYSDSWAIWTYLLLSQWRSSPIQTAGHELISPIVLTALVWIPSELQTTEYNLGIFWCNN